MGRGMRCGGVGLGKLLENYVVGGWCTEGLAWVSLSVVKWGRGMGRGVVLVR